MEFYFLLLLIGLMAFALGSGYPVAFALPGSAIITIVIAAISGYFVAGDADAYFAQGSAVNWLTAGVTNFRGIYWEVERDTLIAIPLFIFMGVMLQRSKIALPAARFARRARWARSFRRPSFLLFLPISLPAPSIKPEPRVRRSTRPRPANFRCPANMASSRLRRVTCSWVRLCRA